MKCFEMDGFFFTVNLLKLLSSHFFTIPHRREKEENSGFNQALIIIAIKVIGIVLDRTDFVCFCNNFLDKF